MKKLAIIAIIFGSLALFTCKKDDNSARFILLTTPVWASDSLLANGEDASGPGQILENFKGDAKFKTDGTGQFGIYKGKWSLAYNDTEIIIKADSLALPLTTQIVELTEASLKITTAYPNVIKPEEPILLRLTFNAK